MSKDAVVRLRVASSVLERYVEAAWGERVSVSEWLRRAAEARLAGGGVSEGRGLASTVPGPGARHREVSVSPPPPVSRDDAVRDVVYEPFEETP